MNSFNNIKIRENSSIIFVDSLEGIVNCEPTFNRNDEIFEKIFGINGGPIKGNEQFDQNSNQSLDNKRFFITDKMTTNDKTPNEKKDLKYFVDSIVGKIFMNIFIVMLKIIFLVNIHKNRKTHDKHHKPNQFKKIKGHIINNCLIDSINKILAYFKFKQKIKKINLQVSKKQINLHFMEMTLKKLFVYQNQKNDKSHPNQKVINEIYNKNNNTINAILDLKFEDYLLFFLYQKELDEILPNIEEDIKSNFIRVDTLIKKKFPNNKNIQGKNNKDCLLYIFCLLNYKYYYYTMKGRDKPYKKRNKKGKFVISRK